MMGPNPKIHYLPLDPEVFAKLHWAGKNFHIELKEYPEKAGEIEVNDLVMFQQYDAAARHYSGQERLYQIGYLLDDTHDGIKQGYVAFSLHEPDCWHHPNEEYGDVYEAHFPEQGERVLVEGFQCYHWATFRVEVSKTLPYEDDLPIFRRDDECEVDGWRTRWIPEKIWAMYKGHRLP